MSQSDLDHIPVHLSWLTTLHEGMNLMKRWTYINFLTFHAVWFLKRDQSYLWEWNIHLGFTLFKDVEQAIPSILNKMGRSTVCVKGSLVHILLIDEEAAWLGE